VQWTLGLLKKGLGCEDWWSGWTFGPCTGHSVLCSCRPMRPTVGAQLGQPRQATIRQGVGEVGYSALGVRGLSGSCCPSEVHCAPLTAANGQAHMATGEVG
jgi:hypothetical protein